MRNWRRFGLAYGLLAAVVLMLPKAASAQVNPNMSPPPAAPDDAETAPPPPEGSEEGTTLDNAPPPPETQAPVRTPDAATFEQRLSPYGRWVDTSEYGRVWIPSGVSSDWQPYTDGTWVDTSYGWSFASTVPWGWAVFHYGRWGFGPRLGWFWTPGYRWAPAWVSWRYSPGYFCWSPLAPRGFYGGGGRWPGWVVVPSHRFRGPIWGARVPWTHAGPILHRAYPVRTIGRPAFGGFRGHGVGARGGGAFHGGGPVRGGSPSRGGGGHRFWSGGSSGNRR